MMPGSKGLLTLTSWKGLMVRLAIVEDEKIYADTIMNYLEQFQTESGYEIETVWFQDGSDIAEKYESNFDIILMDIQMKFMDGMTAAKKIRGLDSEVVIVFLTNMTDYAIRGYEVGAMDYIVKPVAYFAFCETMKRALRKIKSDTLQYLSVPVEGGIQKIDISSIYYVESYGHKLLYKLQEAEVESSGTMNKLESVLIPYGFYRNSKSFLVNLEYVESIKRNECTVHGTRLPVSRVKKKEFMHVLLNHMSAVM